MSHGLDFKKYLNNFSDNLEKNYIVVKRDVRYKNDDGNFTANGGCFVRCLRKCSFKIPLL